MVVSLFCQIKLPLKLISLNLVTIFVNYLNLFEKIQELINPGKKEIRTLKLAIFVLFKHIRRAFFHLEAVLVRIMLFILMVYISQFLIGKLRSFDR